MADFWVLVVRFVVAVIVAIAAASKLGARDRFERVVAAYELLPAPWIRPVATVLPPVEALAAAALVIGVATPVVAALLALLFTAFGAGIAFNVARGRTISCGCFGVDERDSATWWTVARNAALVVACVVLVVAPPSALSLAPFASGASVDAGDALAAPVVAAAAVVLVRLAVEAARLRRALAATPEGGMR